MQTAKPQRRKPRSRQRVIITLEDKADGLLDCSIAFKPEVKGEAPMTPAVHAAMSMIESLAKFLKARR